PRGHAGRTRRTSTSSASVTPFLSALQRSPPPRWAGGGDAAGRRADRGPTRRPGAARDVAGRRGGQDLLGAYLSSLASTSRPERISRSSPSTVISVPADLEY